MSEEEIAKMYYESDEHIKCQKEIERLREENDIAQEKVKSAIKEIERLGNELQVQIEDNVRLNEYIEEKDKEIQRLNNIINEFEIWLLEHSKVDYGCAESIAHEQLALGIAFNYLQELKGSDKE